MKSELDRDDNSMADGGMAVSARRAEPGLLACAVCALGGMLEGVENVVSSRALRKSLGYRWLRTCGNPLCRANMTTSQTMA